MQRFSLFLTHINEHHQIAGHALTYIKIDSSSCSRIVNLRGITSQGIWVKKADYPGCFTHSLISFVVDGKGYVGLGSDVCDDIWEFDPEANTWTKQNPFPGIGRANRPVSFSLADKGYVTLGDDGQGNYTHDLWEYDHTTDTWEEKAPFPGLGRGVAVCFTIGTVAYVGTGENYDNQNYQILDDFWSYDQSNNTWTQIASLPVALVGAVAFGAAGKGFVGSGNDGTDLVNTFFTYDPVEDAWTQIEDLPREIPTTLATGFAIRNQGYFGMGVDDA
jgi:N-acetylneuraminic acid mutarotase